ncbi:uncharacterized protein N7473_013269 [Penicillium subrubescens]|jgi:hypothetical protein|uniref:Uncharacterized protein n=1 Tax=Penicillium subrubescens TaxID=1316194 RepID=A0A1Q5TEP8_9EURO|nr:uncharacterized protein N7473_013269 [Penicillium subrubescens]KAJ5873396.1 hypothetical protein N7473_013269 [Penicillium subrubescens]OKO98662.1 hypothetical protein PENSUB_9102 [Penicillium subrubescens]
MAGLGLELYYSLDIEENPSTATRSDLPVQHLFAEDPVNEDLLFAEDPAALRITLPLLPLDRRYDTLEEGVKAINELGLEYSYAVVKRRSKKTKG